MAACRTRTPAGAMRSSQTASARHTGGDAWHPVARSSSIFGSPLWPQGADTLFQSVWRVRAAQFQFSLVRPLTTRAIRAM